MTDELRTALRICPLCEATCGLTGSQPDVRNVAHYTPPVLPRRLGGGRRRSGRGSGTAVLNGIPVTVRRAGGQGDSADAGQSRTSAIA